MKNILNLLFFLLLVGASFIACEREIMEPEVLDTSYFPLETGKYAIYAVDSIVYNDFEGTVDTTSFLLKEEIGETETDNLGKTYYRINRYRKADTLGSSWVFDGVWAAQQVDQFAYRIENNLRYINIVFPVTLDKNWDGIVYIRRDTTVSIPGGDIDLYKDWDDFRITELHQTETIQGITYDSVLTVLRVDKVNNIERRFSEEKFAAGVGLIYRKDSILDTQCGGNITPACINEEWAVKAERGFIVNQELIETNW
jgi:hypothetical protein